MQVQEVTSNVKKGVDSVKQVGEAVGKAYADVC